MFPSIIQNRIPKLPSIRRSVSDFRSRPNHTRTISVSAQNSRSETPPTYTSKQGSIMPNGWSTAMTDAEESNDASTYDRPISSGSALPVFNSSETESGINWKYANQGLTLVAQAYQESSSLARDGEEGLPPLSRQLYIHGITYLLRGLPADMTPEEIMSVQAAIPPNVLQVLSLDPACQALIPALAWRPLVPDRGLEEEASILQQVTAALVLQFFRTLQIILPYVKLFIGHAYHYEREHRISERIFSKGVHTIDEFGRWCVQFTHTICKMNDGKVGQAINELTTWWVRGVTGGIHQGISEGVVVLGAERSQIPWLRRTAAD